MVQLQLVSVASTCYSLVSEVTFQRAVTVISSRADDSDVRLISVKVIERTHWSDFLNEGCHFIAKAYY